MNPLLSFLIALPVVFPAIIFSIEQGYLRIPLPSVAAGYFVERIPHEDFPPTPWQYKDFVVDNTTLPSAKRLFENKIHGSESVEVAKDGTLWLADKFGDVWRAHPSASGSYELEEKPFVYLGVGRPLGFHLDHDGNLIVCDSLKGLLRVNTTSKQVEILTAQVSEGPLDEGAKFEYVNDLDIAANGTIFFSSSQAFPPMRNSLGFWDTFTAYTTGLAAGRHAGRLLTYDPASKATRVLMDGMWFANGVALAADESYVLVVETNWLRLRRYWLKGPKAGSSEVVLDRLPAFPDGLTRASDGGFWVSLVAPMLPVYRLTSSPCVRALVAWLPTGMRPKPTARGLLLKVSSDLQPQKLYMEPTGQRVAFVSASTEANGKLFLGNLVQSYVSVVQL